MTSWLFQVKIDYRGSPDNTNFGPPGDRTIAKIVLSGDWFWFLTEEIQYHDGL